MFKIKKGTSVKVIPWLPPFPGCIVNLGVFPGNTAVNGCIASEWHTQNRETTNIAQLVERQYNNPTVYGSNYAAHSSAAYRHWTLMVIVKE